MKQSAGKVNTEVLFVLLQTMLYGAFLFLDLTGQKAYLSNRIKFSIILLCFCYALLYRKGAVKSIIFCIRTAILFTVISDLFILILDYYFYGVLTFILVQQLYGIRNSLVMKKNQGVKNATSLLNSFLLRITIQTLLTCIVSIVLIQMGVTPERLLLASIFYFICIATNVIMAIKAAVADPKRENVLFALGISLFVLCDINVGLFNLSGFISIPDNVYSMLYVVSSILMWTFYAPSQVLIVLSCDNHIGKIHKKV